MKTFIKNSSTLRLVAITLTLLTILILQISFSSINTSFPSKYTLSSSENQRRENSKRLQKLYNQCQNYKSNLPVRLTQAAYNYLPQALNVLEATSYNKQGLIAACIPPKSGRTNWYTLLYAIYENTTIDEAVQYKKEAGGDFYFSLPKLLSNSKKVMKNGKYIFTSNKSSQNLAQIPFYIRTLIEKLKIGVDEKVTYSARKISKQNQAILNVRHPFTRLLSAWRSKFTVYSKTEIAKAFKKNIDKCKQLDRIHEWESPKKKYCSFKAFIRMLVTDLTQDNIANGLINEHFLPITYYCAPCLLPYTQIIKAETSEADSKLFLSNLGISHLTLPGRYEQSLVKGDTIENQLLSAKEYYNDIDKQEILKLYEIFYWDFQLFGYNVDQFL